MVGAVGQLPNDQFSTWLEEFMAVCQSCAQIFGCVQDLDIQLVIRHNMHHQDTVINYRSWVLDLPVLWRKDRIPRAAINLIPQW